MLNKMRKLGLVLLTILSVITLPNVFAVNNFTVSLYQLQGGEYDYNDTDTTFVVNDDNPLYLDWSNQGAGYYDVKIDNTKINDSILQTTEYVIPAASLVGKGSFNLTIQEYDDSSGTIAGEISTVYTVTVDIILPVELTSVKFDGTVNTEIWGKAGITNLEFVDNSTTNSHKVYVSTSTTTNYVEVTTSNAVTIDESAKTVEIDFTTAGLNYVGQKILIAMKAVDDAGNVSASYSTTLTYNYDVTAPLKPSNLVVKDDDTTIGTVRNDFDSLSWTASTSTDILYYKLDYSLDGTTYINMSSTIPATDTTLNYIKALDGNGNTYINKNLNSSGSESVYDAGTDVIVTHDANVYFKLTSIDKAGNVSAESEIVTFKFDNVAPDVTISYVDGTTTTDIDLDPGTPPLLNQVKQQTIVVEDTSSDIYSYVVTNSNDTVIYSRTGTYATAAQLQEDLRKLTANSTYTIVIKDAANNGLGTDGTSVYKIQFDLDGPVLTNYYLTITSSDTNVYGGVTTTLNIDFIASSSTVDHYSLYINGVEIRELTATEISNGKVTETITSLNYGDVKNDYQIKAFDSADNKVSYYIRTHTIEDIAKPIAIITQTTSLAESITFTVDLKDPTSSIDEVYARLYDNGTFVEKIALSEGVHEYTFDDLDDNSTYYKIDVIADYEFNNTDYNDTEISLIKPASTYVSSKYNIMTTNTSPDLIAEFTKVDVSYDTVKVDIKATKDVTTDEVYDVYIYEVGSTTTATTYTLPTGIEPIEVEMNTTAYTLTSAVEFTGLTNNKHYQIRVLDGSDVVATANIYTSKVMPTVTFDTVVKDDNIIEVPITISDPSDAVSSGTSPFMNVVYEGEIIYTKTLTPDTKTTITIPDLEYYDEYIINVYATYSLNTTIVSNELLGTTTVITAKKPPVATIYNVESTNDEVNFDVKIEDDDNALTETLLVLYKDGIQIGDPIAINEGTFRDRVFSNLDSNSDYRINVEVKYDLADGKGIITKDSYLTPSAFNNAFYNVDFSTYKGIPVIDVIDYDLTNTSIVIEVEVDDEDGAYEDGFIKLFSLTSSSPIKMYTLLGSTKQTFSFTGLNPDTTYRVVVDSNYDLEDGEGEQSDDIYDVRYKTHKNISADVLSVTKEDDSLLVSIDVVDYLTEDIYAKLYLGTTLIGEARPLNVGTNNLVFSNLDYNTTYTLIVDYDDSATQLINSEVKSSEIEPKTIPTVVLDTAEVTQDRVFIKATITDVDDAITSVEVKFCVDSEACTVYEVTVAELSAGKEFTLPADEQTATIKVEYNTLLEMGVTTVESDTLVKVVVEPEEPVDPEEPTEPEEPVNVTPEDDGGGMSGLEITLTIMLVLTLGSMGGFGYLLYSKGFFKK